MRNSVGVLVGIVVLLAIGGALIGTAPAPTAKPPGAQAILSPPDARMTDQAAQEKPTPSKPSESVVAEKSPPTLTDVQKLTIQNLVQRIEIAQLRAQAAQQEFERAREEITKLVQALQVPGYDLSLERLEYLKKSEPKKESPK